MITQPRGPGEDLLRSAARWWTITGIWALIAGSVAILWPAATALVLALLVGFYFIVAGAALITISARNRHTAPEWRWRVALGFVAVVAGALTWAWPGVTVWALAALFGVAAIVIGTGEITTALAFRGVLPGWGWTVASGAVAVLAGAVALVWPGITAFALAVVVGVYLLSYGVVALAAGVRVRRAAKRLHETGSTLLHLDGFDVEVHDICIATPSGRWGRSEACSRSRSSTVGPSSTRRCSSRRPSTASSPSGCKPSWPTSPASPERTTATGRRNLE